MKGETVYVKRGGRFVELDALDALASAGRVDRGDWLLRLAPGETSLTRLSAPESAESSASLSARLAQQAGRRELARVICAHLVSSLPGSGSASLADVAGWAAEAVEDLAGRRAEGL